MARRVDVLSPEFQSYLNELEQDNDLPAGTLTKISFIETNLGQNRSTSSAGAQGLFQFIPSTAKRFGVDVSDDYSSAKGAAQYLGMLNKRYDGDTVKAAAAYNWGEGKVDKNYDKGILPRETRNYVSMFRDGVDPSGKRQKSLDGLLATINGGKTMTAGMIQDYNGNNSNQTFDTSAFSLDDLEPKQTAQPQVNNNQSIPAADNTPTSLNNTFDTSAFSLDDLEPKQTAQPQAVAAQPTAQQTQAQADAKDAAIFQKFSQSQDPTGFYMSLPPAQQQTVKASLEKYAQANPDAAQTPFYKSAAIGFGLGVNNVYQAARQGIGYLTNDDELYNDARNNIERQRTNQELLDIADPNQAKYRTTGEIAGEVLPSLATPQATVLRGAGLASRVGNAAINGGLVAGATTGSEAQKEDYLKDKAIQTAVGAVAAPVVGETVRAVAQPIARVISGRLPAADEAAQRAAQSEGINLLGSELPSASQATRNAGQTAARTNKDVNDVVKSNIQAGQTAVNDIRNGYQTFDNANYLSTRPEISREATSGGAYSRQAQELQNKIASITPDDPNAILKATAEAEMLSRRIRSRDLYDNANSLAPSVNLQANNFGSALRDLDSSIANATTQSKVNKLTAIKNDLSVTDPSNISLTQSNNLIRDLGELQRDARSAQDLVTSNMYGNLRSAIQKDVDSFVNSNNSQYKPFADAYKAATKYNAENIQANKSDNVFQQLFSATDKNGAPISSDNVIQNWIKKGDTTRIQKLFDNVDDEGKNAVRTGVLNSLMAKASNNNQAELDPKAFAKAYKSYKSSTSDATPLDVVFGGASNARVRNLMGVFDNINTAAASRSNPETGVKMVDLLKRHAPTLGAAIGVGGSAVTGGIAPLLIGAGAGGAYVLRNKAYTTMLTNPKYNKFLLEFANTNPNSAKFIDRFERFAKIIGAEESAQQATEQ